MGGDKGTAGGAGGGFKLTSLGGDLYGKSDHCFQILTPVVGDFSITCQIVWEKAGDDWAKAGLVWRESTDAKAANVAVVTSYKKHMRLQSRTKAGEDTRTRGGGVQSKPMVLMRLERQGNTFRGEMTTDGKFWVKQKTGGKFQSSGYLGFVVASKTTKARATANFAIKSAKGQVTSEGNVVMLEKEEYQAIESGKAVTLTARRVGDGKGELKVSWTAKSGTAQAGKDFVGESGQIVWKNGQTGQKKFAIPITNNGRPEKDKMFSVTLEEPKDGAKLGQRQARVTIIDDDGPGQIRFEQMVTCAPDSKTTVAQIKVLRQYGRQGVVDVRYSIRPGKAKPGDKYKDVSGHLTWQDGDNKPKIIKVPILWPELVASNTEELLVDNIGGKKDPKKKDPKKVDPRTIVDEDE